MGTVLSLQVESFEEGNKKTGKSTKKGPSGFAKSCTGIKYDSKKAVLTASCKNKKGKKMKASLKVGNCVTNSNGALKKGKAFHKSCKVAKSILSCLAKNKKGKYVKSKIDLNKIVGN